MNGTQMVNEFVHIEQSKALHGELPLVGAKNAVLVIMASLILTSGKSILRNVPCSDDVYQMIELLRVLGAEVSFDEQAQILYADTSTIVHHTVPLEIMKKLRATILVMGPLVARFGQANVAVPGGCVLGARPIDFHIRALAQMGAEVTMAGDFITVHGSTLRSGSIILEYPSVGATENILMTAALMKGTTRIVNAALEPEVFDLMNVLVKMGAQIRVLPPATIEIIGVQSLHAIEHEIMPDRLEAGTLLLATAITGGTLALPTAPAHSLEVFLEKLSEMGHQITVGANGTGIWFKATDNPRSISFKTMPYPGFPTDLQAPMMVLQCLSSGVSVIHETVFENRLVHVRELQKMGAQITVDGNHVATIKGVDELYGASVIAPDIRAAAGLVIAGLAAHGQTKMTGVHHLRRGYQGLDKKLLQLGAKIAICTE